MNTCKHMIIVKDEIKTKDIISCYYNKQTYKYDIKFNNGKTYGYAYDNVTWLKCPQVLNPELFHIYHNDHELFDICSIYVFQNEYQEYWHICFGNGSERDYIESELNIFKSCLSDSVSKNVFEYLKQIASLSELTNDSGEKLLEKQYEKIDFIGEDTTLSTYLNPQKRELKNSKEKVSIPIFPFGCNQSQYKAVKNALENSVSVIQGPPGTGKTQTILNIIANILISEKTVQIVSNNNSATENILEKLSSPKYNMSFIVAPLGKSENKSRFIETQDGVYPDLATWRFNESNLITLKEIKDDSEQLHTVFSNQEKLALLKHELDALELEFKYFRKYSAETKIDFDSIKIRKNLLSSRIMQLLLECQMLSEKEKKPGLIFKLKSILYDGISDWNFYQQDITKIIASMQGLFYKTKINELRNEIQEAETALNRYGNVSIDSMCEKSMRYLKNVLHNKYGQSKDRRIFTEDDLWKNPYDVMKEYPIVLSTTFSSRTSLCKDVVYDYLIMDEASQVDVATGALALSCARNVIIVGDTKQLPNVVTGKVKESSKVIFDSFQINHGYEYTNSFLQSVLDAIPDVPQTLLREHYRCHPKIINFCNQKFYNDELVIMTQDNGEKDVLSVVRTVKGNHERNHYSQRQIDVIKEEVLPNLFDELSEIGIIAPYKNQVKAMMNEIDSIDTATVHKFQGKEKDTIIISTVDDEITDFADDPYLINVAVSRAKKKLRIVVSGNEQSADRNISDLIAYVEYNNFEIKESQIYSVFDYLYQQYTKCRYEYLQKHKRISEYDSENLMYALLTEVLQMDKFNIFDVICHQSLNMLIRNPDMLSDREYKYAMNPATHLDFLVYNKISKRQVLAIEVDGYEYHKDGMVQAERDKMKNRILEMYNIPFLRFATNGSREKDKIIERLEQLRG